MPGNPIAAGFLSSLVASGGDLRAAVIGGITAGAFSGVGDISGAWGSSSRVLAHGMVGGVSSVLNGGAFKAGFISAAVMQSANLNGAFAKGGNPIVNVMKSAIVGGTVSVVSGGKFANGAKTFAFLRMVSESADFYENSVGQKADMVPGVNREGQTTYAEDPITGRQPLGSEDMNVVGNNDLDSFCRQGSGCSKTLNLVPGINSTARLHDYWFNGQDALDKTLMINVGTMLPAAVMSYSANIGNVIQGWETNPMTTSYVF